MGAEPAHVEAGRAAEAFAYLYMSRHLPKFGLNCWRSGARPHFHPEHGLEGVDDSLGYDFQYHDENGLLSTHGPAICLIEVKSCSLSPDKVEFYMTENEMQKIQATRPAVSKLQNGTSSAGQLVDPGNDTSKVGDSNVQQVYVILLVANPLTSPRIAGLLVDPAALLKEQDMLVSPVSYRIGCNPNVLIEGFQAVRS